MPKCGLHGLGGHPIGAEDEAVCAPALGPTDYQVALRGESL